MTQHFNPSNVGCLPVASRQRRGLKSYLAGEAAETAVAKLYEQNGAQLLARRWRGQAGEIDIVLRQGADLIFVEVKSARCLDRALHALQPRQIERICLSALEFADDQPGGTLSNMRFDLAAVDGAGQIHIVENAFGAV